MWAPIFTIKPNDYYGFFHKVDVTLKFEKIDECADVGNAASAMECAAKTLVDVFNEMNKRHKLTCLEFQSSIAIASNKRPKVKAYSIFFDTWFIRIGKHTDNDLVKHVADKLMTASNTFFGNYKRKLRDAALEEDDKKVWVPVIKCGPATVSAGNKLEWDMCLTWEVTSSCTATDDVSISVVEAMKLFVLELDKLEVEDRFRHFRIIFEMRGLVGINTADRFPNHAFTKRRFRVDKMASYTEKIKQIGIQVVQCMKAENEWQRRNCVPE